MVPRRRFRRERLGRLTVRTVNYDASTRMAGEPVIRRLGACSPGGEMTPFVHEGRLYRLELYNPTGGVDMRQTVAQVRDAESGRVLSRFGEDCYYHSGFYENGRMYVFARGIDDASSVWRFDSADLLHWEKTPLFSYPEFRFYNTGVAHGPDGYWMVIEADRPAEAVGVPFTCFFLRSDDLLHWEMLPKDRCYPKERYCGGPCLKYADGWYYLILVEALPLDRYTNYVHRTKDFFTFETGRYNPFLPVCPQDRVRSPRAADLPAAFDEDLRHGFLSSSSDVDMCDFDGRTYINYLVGNQHGFYYMCEAEYDGPMAELLERQFR